MKKLILALFCISFISIGIFNASELEGRREDYDAYNMTVGPFNDTVTSGSQTKAITDKSGDLDSEVVGGDYTVDMRLYGQDGGTGKWSQNIADNETRSLSNTIDKGDRSKLQISSDLSTSVHVNCFGTWRSN